MDKQTVAIHGKEYETVASRVSRFREDHSEWSIITEIHSLDEKTVVIKASILDEKGAVRATGFAEEKRASSGINSSSALENGETSAIGRSLACLGYLGTEFCSADEFANALKNQSQPAQGTKSSKPTPVKQGPDGLLNEALGFGKNKDNTWGTVDMEYLGWLAGQDGNRAEQAKEVIKIRMAQEEEFKIADDEPPIDSAQDSGDAPF